MNEYVAEYVAEFVAEYWVYNNLFATHGRGMLHIHRLMGVENTIVTNRYKFLQWCLLLRVVTSCCMSNELMARESVAARTNSSAPTSVKLFEYVLAHGSRVLLKKCTFFVAERSLALCVDFVQ